MRKLLCAFFVLTLTMEFASSSWGQSQISAGTVQGDVLDEKGGSVAGATVGSSPIFRGPVRRSSNAAIVRRQLAAAVSRSGALIWTCTNFSASANVVGDTSGPTSGEVPKAGGAPAGGVSIFCSFGASARHAATAPRMPSGARIRNWRREFTIVPGM